MYNKIFLRPKKGKFVTVSMDKILYIKSEDHLCHVYLRDQKIPITISMAIGDFFKHGLPKDQFFMVNRSYIVNVDAMVEFDEGYLKIEKGGEESSFSCGSSKDLKAFISQFPVFPPLS